MRGGGGGEGAGVVGGVRGGVVRGGGGVCGCGFGEGGGWCVGAVWGRGVVVDSPPPLRTRHHEKELSNILHLIPNPQP